MERLEFVIDCSSIFKLIKYKAEHLIYKSGGSGGRGVHESKQNTRNSKIQKEEYSEIVF